MVVLIRLFPAAVLLLLALVVVPSVVANGFFKADRPNNLFDNFMNDVIRRSWKGSNAAFARENKERIWVPPNQRNKTEPSKNTTNSRLDVHHLFGDPNEKVRTEEQRLSTSMPPRRQRVRPGLQRRKTTRRIPGLMTPQQATTVAAAPLELEIFSPNVRKQQKGRFVTKLDYKANNIKRSVTTSANMIVTVPDDGSGLPPAPIQTLVGGSGEIPTFIKQTPPSVEAQRALTAGEKIEESTIVAIESVTETIKQEVPEVAVTEPAEFEVAQAGESTTGEIERVEITTTKSEVEEITVPVTEQTTPEHVEIAPESTLPPTEESTAAKPQPEESTVAATSEQVEIATIADTATTPSLIEESTTAEVKDEITVAATPEQIETITSEATLPPIEESTVVKTESEESTVAATPEQVETATIDTATTPSLVEESTKTQVIEKDESNVVTSETTLPSTEESTVAKTEPDEPTVAATPEQLVAESPVGPAKSLAEDQLDSTDETTPASLPEITTVKTDEISTAIPTTPKPVLTATDGVLVESEKEVEKKVDEFIIPFTRKKTTTTRAPVRVAETDVPIHIAITLADESTKSVEVIATSEQQQAVVVTTPEILIHTPIVAVDKTTPQPIAVTTSPCMKDGKTNELVETTPTPEVVLVSTTPRILGRMSTWRVTPRLDVSAFHNMSCGKRAEPICCKGRDDSERCSVRTPLPRNQTGICYCDEHCLTVSDDFKLPDCCPDFLDACATSLGIDVSKLVPAVVKPSQDESRKVPTMRTKARLAARRFRNKAQLGMYRKKPLRKKNLRLQRVMRAFVIDPKD